MLVESKHNMTVAENAIHAVLKPLGFKKQKTNWRRRTEEIHQQFSLYTHRHQHVYRPAWGLNLLSRCEDPVPAYHKLQVEWEIVEVVPDSEERMGYFFALDFGPPQSIESRAEAATRIKGLPITDSDGKKVTHLEAWERQKKIILKHNYDKPMSDEVRAELVSKLIRGYVVPCFETFTTQAAVLDIVKNKQKQSPPLGTSRINIVVRNLVFDTDNP